MKNSIFLIPLYNKSNTIQYTVEALKNKFENVSSNEKFIFIENESTDNSYEKILSLTKKDSRFHVIKSKKGFGTAIRTGMNYLNKNFELKNSILILTAADLPFGFSDLDYYFNKPSEQTSDLYIGSKAHKLSQIERSFLRVFLSKVFNFLILIFFKVGVGDTQGTYIINLQNVDLLKIIPKSNNFFATAEICIKAIHSGYKVIEIPIICEESDIDSTVRVFRDTFKMFKEMLEFKFR